MADRHSLILRVDFYHIQSLEPLFDPRFLIDLTPYRYSCSRLQPVAYPCTGTAVDLSRDRLPPVPLQYSRQSDHVTCSVLAECHAGRVVSILSQPPPRGPRPKPTARNPLWQQLGVLEEGDRHSAQVQRAASSAWRSA